MTKKARSPVKKANSVGSMGRILFYSVALIVACCAVAVVLFETEAGQELVAKVRGKEAKNTRADAKAKFTEAKPSEGKEKEESVGTQRKEQEKPAESVLPRAESVLNSERDTSANRNNPHETSSGESRNEEANLENVAEESKTEAANDREIPSEVDPHTDEAASNTVSGDSNKENEKWETIDEGIDEDEPAVKHDEPVVEQEKPVQEQDAPVPEQEKPLQEQDTPVAEQEKPIQEQDVPVVELEKAVEGQGKPNDEPVLNEPESEKKLQPDEMNSDDQNVGETEQVAREEVKESEEKVNIEVNDVEEQVDDGKKEEKETIEVGDSLAELERQRNKERLFANEERYDPIPEPEGPPIDQSPVNARRGLRGDYGRKGTMITH